MEWWSLNLENTSSSTLNQPTGSSQLELWCRGRWNPMINNENLACILTFPPGNRSLMRGNSVTASETEAFPIPPGPRMQTREVSSCRSNCAIPSTKSSRPWKISGFNGISCRECVFDIGCVPDLLSSNMIVWISSTLWCMSSNLCRRAWRSLMRAESRRSFASWRNGNFSLPSAGRHLSRYTPWTSPSQSIADLYIHRVHPC